MMLHFGRPAKLKTKTIVFEDVYAVSDSASLEQLKELTSKRRAIEKSINDSSGVIAREMSGGSASRIEQDLHKIEQYLPLLENFFFYAKAIGSNHRMVQWTSSLRIRWSSALSSSSVFKLKVPEFFQIDNLRFELDMMHFLYAAILRERALEVLSVDLVQSATLFREAAGIYHYLAHDILPPLQPVLPPERPPESLAAISTTMSLICLADAQAVTIKKAEEKGSSSSLLAKLHHGITLFLNEAVGVLNAVTKECKDVSSCLSEFIFYSKSIHELKGQKHFAENLKTSGEIGTAIGVLRSALINVKKKMPRKESWKSIYQKEIHDASEVLRKFVYENDNVWREKIPAPDQLPVPQGSKIVNFIPFCPKRWERQLAFKVQE